MTTNAKARRAYETSLFSLNAAEDLLKVLADNPLPGNDYWQDALDKANALVIEVAHDLECVMDTYSPEECGA